MDSVSELWNWVLGSFSIIVGCMAGVINKMYKQEQKTNAKAIKDLEARLEASDKKHQECEESREQLAIGSARLEERIAAIEEAVKNS